MDNYIGHEPDKRYEEFKANPDSKRTKTVIDLVLQAYLPDTTKPRSERLDPKFRAFAISQIRLFVFVGHDSTSGTIYYILHLLATNPNTLAQVRAKHDRLLGPDFSAVPSLFKEHPHLTNHLVYTTAAIKEGLRLFPRGACRRAGSPSVDLIDDQGNRCPTKDTAAIFTIHTEMHQAPAYWVRPGDSLPERWLANCGHEIRPMKEAFRAFEIRPRNCVALGFVMTEHG